MTTGHVTDVNETIVQEFRANQGRVGGQFEGVPLIPIHHIGARSGEERVTPLGCLPQPDGGLVIVASNGGAPKNPDWCRNLKAHSEIDVEFGADRFAVAVTELEGAERANVWADAVAAHPDLDQFQRRTTRTIPVILLTRRSDA